MVILLEIKRPARSNRAKRSALRDTLCESLAECDYVVRIADHGRSTIMTMASRRARVWDIMPLPVLSLQAR